MKSYDYAHRAGVKPITWGEFARLSRKLAEKIEPFHPHAVIGIARAGLFPAIAVACSLRCELFPIRLTRRFKDQVITEVPVWKVPILEDVQGKIVAIVDEIADSGQTLAIAAESARAKGAAQVITASLVSHPWADPPPMLSALVSDAFIIFPWDRQILQQGRWVTHPEIEAGIAAQSRKLDI